MEYERKDLPREREYYNGLDAEEKRFYDKLSREEKDWFLEMGTTNTGKEFRKTMKNSLEELKLIRENIKDINSKYVVLNF